MLRPAAFPLPDYLNNHRQYNGGMKTPERLETKRLILRQPRWDHARAVFEGRAQDRELTPCLPWRPHERIERSEELLRSCIPASGSLTRFPYMIVWKENSEVIGMIDPRVEGQRGVIGYPVRGNSA
jgi:ribosomal-protein-alanine N-acetyltransferase